MARRQVNVRRAIEYLQTGLYKQQFSQDGKFMGIVYSPETAKPVKPSYIPEELPALELPGLRFVQPANAIPTSERTITQYAFQ